MEQNRADETSARRGQDYNTFLTDLDTQRVMFATDLAAHGGEPKTQIKRGRCDISPAFIKGVNTHLSAAPGAAIAAVPGVEPAGGGQQAFDQVRRTELKLFRYIWLKTMRTCP